MSSVPDSGRYAARGVSASKGEVHAVVDKLDRGLFPVAFCKITEDFLTGDPGLCNITHSDGSGTKSLLAYLWWKETGDASVFRGIARYLLLEGGAHPCQLRGVHAGCFRYEGDVLR